LNLKVVAMTAALSSENLPRPWFREPLVWMVIGGPLLVVIASMITLALAIKYPDEVIQKPAAPAVSEQMLKNLTPEERAAVLSSMEPAQKARNHVASPPALAKP
jgi:uncharacterized protein